MMRTDSRTLTGGWMPLRVPRRERRDEEGALELSPRLEPGASEARISDKREAE